MNPVSFRQYIHVKLLFCNMESQRNHLLSEVQDFIIIV